MFITGLGTAAPERQFTQAECLAAFQRAPRFASLKPRSQALLQKVLLGQGGIESRHFAVDDLADAFDLRPDTLQRRFERQAPPLAAQAARRALDHAAVAPGDVDALLISTCTGYLCPGLTSYVSEALGLLPGALLLDLVGQGCGAAVPNLRTADALLGSGRCQHVVSVCVEICSAAFYLDDDPGVLISACLFGDGAAAAVLERAPRGGHRRVRWHAADTRLSAEDRDYLRFEHRDGMLRNILARQVPALAAKHAETLLKDMLASSGIRRDAITGWILHGGGRDVLDALAARLQLDPAALTHSRDVLRRFGNVSSPFVLFALQRALESGAPGGWWWLSSFGAGFSCHGALLEVE